MVFLLGLIKFILSQPGTLIFSNLFIIAHQDKVEADMDSILLQSCCSFVLENVICIALGVVL